MWTYGKRQYYNITMMNLTTDERFGIYTFLEVSEFPNIKQIESTHFS